jgi:hypothetical protein
MHGAGSGKREREGRRKNPRLAPVRHGFRAQRATARALVDAEPDLAAEYQRRLIEAGYNSVREERALAEALLHRFLDAADLTHADALDAALSATARIAMLKEREERAARSAGLVGAEDLLAFLRALGRAVERYVPEGDRDPFNDVLREAALPAGN